MQNKFLTLDQGTTSSRAIVFNHDGETVSISQNHLNRYSQTWMGRTCEMRFGLLKLVALQKLSLK
jgi:glycerol kinase